MTRRFVLTAALAAVLSGCGADDGDPPRRSLVLTGSSTVAPLAGELAKRFEALHPGTRIDVQTGGSSSGSASPVRWRSGPTSSCWTNPARPSTPWPARWWRS